MGPKPIPKAELRGPEYRWTIFVSPFTCGSLSHPLLLTSRGTTKKGIALLHCAVSTRHGQNSVPTTEWPVTSLRSEYTPLSLDMYLALSKVVSRAGAAKWPVTTPVRYADGAPSGSRRVHACTSFQAKSRPQRPPRQLLGDPRARLRCLVRPSSPRRYPPPLLPPSRDTRRQRRRPLDIWGIQATARSTKRQRPFL